jgi:hypothetical protein
MHDQRKKFRFQEGAGRKGLFENRLQGGTEA